MKKTILYILLIISSVALSACSGENKLMAQSSRQFDWFGAFMKGDRLPKAWLCTDRVLYASENYGGKIDPFYFIGADFFEGVPDWLISDDVHFINNLVASVNRTMNDSIFCSFSNESRENGRGELILNRCRYTADVRIEAGEEIGDILHPDREGQLDSLLDVFCGRLVVDVTITSIEDSPCAIHLPLVNHHLARPTGNPIALAFFLYKAVENGGEWQVSSSTIEPEEYVDWLKRTYS